MRTCICAYMHVSGGKKRAISHLYLVDQYIHTYIHHAYIHMCIHACIRGQKASDLAPVFSEESVNQQPGSLSKRSNNRPPSMSGQDMSELTNKLSRQDCEYACIHVNNIHGPYIPIDVLVLHNN